MSLDVYLEVVEPQKVVLGTGVYVREGGKTRELTVPECRERYPHWKPPEPEEVDTRRVFQANITHNLGRMADAAGIYQHLWRHEEVGVTHAEHLIQPLTDGLALLKSDPKRFKAFNPENGWGTYEGMIEFVTDYLEACKKWPQAEVQASR